MLTSNALNDQATGLRRLVAPRPVRVVAVTGGKGGVGKTNVSVNLAIALAELERRVMLLDADLGLANVDVVLGLHPPFDLSHVIRGERELQEVVMQGPGGIQVIPGASGVKEMAALSEAEHAGLIQAFSDLGADLDTLIVDTAAGISDTVISFARAAHEVLMVVCDEPASLTDAYAIIKLLNRDHGQSRFRVLANMVQSNQEGHELYNKLCRVTDRYLDVMLGYVGCIPHDEALRKAVRGQRAVVQAYPRSRVAQAFRSLARKIDALPMPTGANGQLQFFVERLIQYSTEFGEIGR
jgi:flagellar biosynthesis protein FlhG